MDSRVNVPVDSRINKFVDSRRSQQERADPIWDVEKMLREVARLEDVRENLIQQYRQAYFSHQLDAETHFIMNRAYQDAGRKQQLLREILGSE